MTTIVVDVSQKTIWADSRTTWYDIHKPMFGRGYETFDKYVEDCTKIFEDDYYIWAGSGYVPERIRFRRDNFKGPLSVGNRMIVVNKLTDKVLFYTGTAKPLSALDNLLIFMGLKDYPEGVDVDEVTWQAIIGTGACVASARMDANMSAEDVIKSASRQDKYTNDRITSVSW